MYFYQAQWWGEGNQFGELRSTREEAIADLAAMGCPVEELVFEASALGVAYVPGTGYGIAVARV